ncbi:MAG: hypothetical protein K940chlam9_01974 [Chlamydiae bacterium]|nr:hypothetical protein [Chlamydiota bacterium]
MTIYSQHTLQLHQTNNGYSLEGKAFSSKKSIYNYLSCLPVDLVKLVEEKKNSYHYHSVSYSSKQNLRKALSRDSGRTWI